MNRGWYNDDTMDNFFRMGQLAQSSMNSGADNYYRNQQLQQQAAQLEEQRRQAMQREALSQAQEAREQGRYNAESPYFDDQMKIRSQTGWATANNIWGNGERTNLDNNFARETQPDRIAADKVTNQNIFKLGTAKQPLISEMVDRQNKIDQMEFDRIDSENKRRILLDPGQTNFQLSKQRHDQDSLELAHRNLYPDDWFDKSRQQSEFDRRWMEDRASLDRFNFQFKLTPQEDRYPLSPGDQRREDAQRIKTSRELTDKQELTELGRIISSKSFMLFSPDEQKKLTDQYKMRMGMPVDLPTGGGAGDDDPNALNFGGQPEAPVGPSGVPGKIGRATQPAPQRATEIAVQPPAAQPKTGDNRQLMEISKAARSMTFSKDEIEALGVIGMALAQGLPYGAALNAAAGSNAELRGRVNARMESALQRNNSMQPR